MRIKLVLLKIIEEINYVILQLHKVLLEIALIDYGATILKADPCVIKEVLNGVVIVRYVEVGAHDYLLDSQLPEPFLVHCIICHAVWVIKGVVRISRTSLVQKVQLLVLWRTPESLNGYILPVGAIIRLNPIAFYFCNICIMEISTHNTVREWYWGITIVRARGIIDHHHLPKYKLTVLWVI